MYMTAPQRSKGKEWEKQVVKVKQEDLEDIDKPSVSKKPHIYYW